jgi:4'-phosphopantetheinyl transferase
VADHKLPAPLGPREAQVWLLDLDLPPERAAAAAALLSADEQERAGHFLVPEPKRRYIAARGQLRQVLGACTGASPAALVFSYAAHGKPRLAEPSQGVEFNLAHSHELGVLAVTRQAPIGVDVEFASRRVDLRTIAERFFAPAEAAQLASLPEAEQLAAFLRCWTRKEAVLKARGDGLSLPLDRFVVSLLPGEPPRVVWLAPELRPAEWTLFNVAAPPGYVAAGAITGALPQLVECGFWPASA